MSAKCPVCGAKVTRLHFHRNGWYYGDCGRKYNFDRKEWGPNVCSCLTRQISSLEESQDDAESIMGCLAMQARFFQRDMPLTTPVLQNGNSKLTVAVLFLAEDWYVNRLDAEKRAEWEKRADEMRAEARKGGVAR